mgnify:CR=1 FL=1
MAVGAVGGGDQVRLAQGHGDSDGDRLLADAGVNRAVDQVGVFQRQERALKLADQVEQAQHADQIVAADGEEVGVPGLQPATDRGSSHQGLFAHDTSTEG